MDDLFEEDEPSNKLVHTYRQKVDIDELFEGEVDTPNIKIESYYNKATNSSKHVNQINTPNDSISYQHKNKIN